MKFILTTILLYLALWSNAQTPLVGVQDGQWFTFQKGKKSYLPKEFHDVGNFDNQNLAYFMRHDRYGLINPEGKVILEEQFISVEQLKGGYYKFLRQDGLELVQSFEGQLTLTPCKSIKNLENNWYIFKSDSGRTLLNTTARLEYDLHPTDSVVGNFYGYIFIRHGYNNEPVLFNKLGEIVDMGENYPKFRQGYLIIESVESKKVVYPDHQIELPINASDIIVEESEIYYTLDGVTKIISTIDQHVILEVKCESLQPIGRGLFTMRKNGKLGVITKEGEVICGMNYNFISLQGNYLMVRNEQGLGVLDLGGKQLLPCVYDWVNASRDFFLVQSSLNRYGLISRKSKREILACVYNKISFSDSKIRAWSNNKLRIIVVDSLHNITSDLVLDNVITLDRPFASGDESIDNRLFSLGWFNEIVPVFDSLGFKKSENLRWGLKGNNDTTLIEARKNQPLFIPLASFSLVPGSSIKADFGQEALTVRTFSLTSHITGRNLVSERIFSLDTMDLLTRGYSRFYGKKSLGFLTAENKVIYAAYFDGYDTRFVRYCQAKKGTVREAKESDYDHLRYPDANFNNDPSIGMNYTKDKIDWEYVRFEDAKWNFLDTNGRPVFSQPFSFAYPYRRNTAIVQRDGKWGLARADSLIIQPQFSQITRISEISDTLFLTKNTPAGRRYLDTTAAMLTTKISRFSMNKGSLSQVNIGAKKVVINSNYEVISGDTRFQKLFDNDIFYSKENKEYTIYSNQGELLGTTKLKPQGFIRDEYVHVSEKGKKGVVNMFDEVVIPIIYKKIEVIGNYVFAKNGYENKLFDSDLILIKECKNYSVLVDSVSGNYALITATKVVVYDILTRKKIGTWKGGRYTHFVDGWLVQYGKSSRAIHVKSDKVIDFNFELKSLVAMGDGGYLLQDTKKSSHYYTVNWEAKTFKVPLRRAKYIGEGLAICKTKRGLLLFGEDTEKWFPRIGRFTGKFSNGFLLIGSRGKYIFINTLGQNVYRREFIDATPFGSKYATIKEASGWTIMDVRGHYKTLPSFDKIEELGSNIFSTTKQALYGIYDSHGNVIVPVEYQKINVLNKNLLQGYKNGKIFYFNSAGDQIKLN